MEEARRGATSTGEMRLDAMVAGKAKHDATAIGEARRGVVGDICVELVIRFRKTVEIQQHNV